MKKSNLIILIFLGLMIIIWSFFVWFNKPTSAAAIPVKPALTVNEKNEISALLEKEKTNSLNYEEALKYIDAINKYTEKRQFENVKDLKQIYTELNNELSAKSK